MKKMLAVILALVMLLSLAACGGSEEPDVTVPEEPVPEQPVIEEPVDQPNGFIDEAYADSWYLFGDLSFPSLLINTDGTWEIRSGMEGDSFGGNTMCEGFSFNDDRGGLFLHDYEDVEVGYATLGENGLTLSLTSQFEYLLEAYLAGDLVFERESSSHNVEGQPLESNSDQPFEEDDFLEEQPLADSSVLVGEWLYSAHERILNFYSDGSFTWTMADGETTGTYTFDSEYVTFTYDHDGSRSVAYLADDGYLYPNGVDEDYYYKNEEA